MDMVRHVSVTFLTVGRNGWDSSAGRRQQGLALFGNKEK
jgi:hypothetical protein